jgi:histidinol-phosphate/aromatic aminotransferase/cobyric acid decarboxylase-like protein
VAFERKQVGDAERYHGRRLHASFMGPDLLANVNGVELPAFYLTVEAAIAAGRRYVDDQVREEAKKAAKESGK